MQFDLKRLTHLVSVAKHGSFSLAAKELNLTQPAVSRSIITLEEALGIEIFQRNGGQLDVTPTGIEVIHEAKRLLEQRDVLESNIRLLKSGDAGKVSFGLGPGLASCILGDLICHSVKNHPNIKIDAQIFSSTNSDDSRFSQALTKGNIDFLICPSAAVTYRKEYKIEPICPMPMNLFVNCETSLEGCISSSVAEKYPFATMEYGPNKIGNISLLPDVSCNDYDVLKTILLNTQSICYLSPFLVMSELRNGLVRKISLSDAPYSNTLEMVLVRRSDRILSASSIRVSEYAKYLLTSLGDEWRSIES